MSKTFKKNSSNKIAFIGTSNYENKVLIKDTLFNFKQKYPEKYVVTRGYTKQGAESHIKKFSLAFNLHYVEIPAACEQYTMHSLYDKKFYGKTWNFKYYMQQAIIFISKVDYVVCFGDLRTRSKKDLSLGLIIKQAKKVEKEIIYVQ